MHAVHRWVELLQQRQAIGGGLARARLGQHHAVLFALEQHGNGHFLHGGRCGEAAFRKRLQELFVEAEIGEGWSRHGFSRFKSPVSRSKSQVQGEQCCCKGMDDQYSRSNDQVGYAALGRRERSVGSGLRRGLLRVEARGPMSGATASLGIPQLSALTLPCH